MAEKGKSIRKKPDAAGQKWVTEMRQESDEWYRDLLDSANDLIHSIAPDGRFLYVNKTWLRVLGYSEADVSNLKLWDIIHSDSIPHCEEAFQKVCSGGTVSNVEAVFVTKDGKFLQVEGNASCRFEQGKPVSTSGVFRDITERKRAEEALCQSEANLRTYLESAPDGVYISDLNGIFLYANRMAEEITGYKREEFLGKSFLEINLLPAQYLLKAGELLALMALKKSAGPDEFELERKDGSRVWIEMNTAPIAQEGRVVVIGFVRDITGRKQAEEQLLFSDAAFRSIHESVVATDEEYTITRWNEVSERMYGIRAYEALGKKLFDVIEIVENAPGENAKRFQVLETQGYYQEEQLHKTKRAEVWADVSIQSIANDGKRYGWVVLAIDITERKQVAEKILQTNRQLMAQRQELIEKSRELQAASQAKSEFLASMSHELRTPLNAIIGFSELMLDGVPGEVNDEQRQCLGDILSGGRHLLGLINDVLDLSRVEVGKLELRPESLILADTIGEVVQIMKPMLDEGNHKLKINVGEGLPPVCADRSRLRQVLLNLLSNAVKFTPDGGKLGIEAIRDGDRCQISVIDNGIGIKKEDQARIFGAFIQIDSLPDKRKEGTGLGLALARQLVELCGGKMWVKSDYGKGSNFTFTLPLAGGEESYLEEERAVMPLEKLGRGIYEAAGVSPRPGQKRILVVDDDRKSRSLLGAWLKEEGYAIIEASTGDEGIRKARELLPTVIVLDILMPDKNGWQVLQKLKSMPDTRDIPVVIASVIEEKELGFSLGAVDYFVKPIDKKRFLRRIAELELDGEDKVLVVDDNPADVRLVASILGSAGIEVLCAYSGEEGLRMAKDSKPTLIVLDILMPDLSGFEVIDRLRGNEETRDIPIIILTVKDLTGKEKKMLSAQATAIMKKTALRRVDFVREVEQVIKMGRVKPGGR